MADLADHQVRELTAEETGAVARFAKAHGRRWKAQLAEVYWYNARIWRGGEPDDGYVLHTLRNDPRWAHHGLDTYRLPKGAT